MHHLKSELWVHILGVVKLGQTLKKKGLVLFGTGRYIEPPRVHGGMCQFGLEPNLAN